MASWRGGKNRPFHYSSTPELLVLDPNIDQMKTFMGKVVPENV
ncbi:hypothetical protein D3OALGB2SA_4409 [Olavius algarvensis associated proteobacterium Delta 3]|nr:hypothetical protein D3OALGB2SA_4409 [Olavius algarvensis associated proteobacterium Delta 3]